MKLDILAFAAHPDDVELTCSGTLILEIKKGRKVGIVDLTGGEMGTRGSKELRTKEVQEASAVMGIHIRENLGFRDCFFSDDEAHRLAVAKIIRKYRPEVVLCNTPSDRHPDHGRASSLVMNALFLSRLNKLNTELDGVEQDPWHPRAAYHYIQDRYHRPDFVIDVSTVWEQRMKAMMAFSSQFYNPESDEPDSPISSKDFLHFVEGRAREFGRPAGFSLAEGFLVSRTPGVSDLMMLK
jgi:bacillithiol biosynthesis deacetylase BshB1